jgi:hypothetical protein
MSGQPLSMSAVLAAAKVIKNDLITLPSCHRLT